MDCNTARLLLFLASRSEDSDLEEAKALETHLARCPDCASIGQNERSIDSRIVKAMHDITVPSGLRARIIGSLVERRAGPLQAWKRHPRIAGGIAAALFIAAALGLYLAWPKSLIDISQRQAVAAAQYRAQPQAIEEWFLQNYRLMTIAPPNFDYGCLVSYDLVVDQTGKRVPQLLFVRQNNWAKVSIVTGAQFNLGQLLAQSPANSQGLTVEIVPHPLKADVAYLVVHNGTSLDWLMSTGSFSA